jgi:hypothetical protein
MLKSSDITSVENIVGLTQAALGCGIGLLLATRIRRSAHETTALALVSVGIISALPLAVEFFSSCVTRTQSDRTMRKRLASIREDSGFSEEAEVF